jgi:uncharacterized membrane protein YccC
MGAAFVVLFWLLPGGDGFVMLAAAIAPFLMIGPWLGTRPRLAAMGPGFSIGFVYLLGLKNPMVYDVLHVLNDSLAQLAGVALTGVAFVFVPAVAGSLWQRRRQMQRLREQVVQAASAPLRGLAWRFESVSRDLFQQVVTHAGADSAESRSLLAWALAVHECGRALIELRRELADSGATPAVQQQVHAAIHRMARLFRHPGVARWQSADRAVGRALAACVQAGASAMPLRPWLHQLRSALHDDESPMVAYLGPVLPETAHAA